MRGHARPRRLKPGQPGALGPSFLTGRNDKCQRWPGRLMSPVPPYLDMTRRATALAASENSEMVPFVTATEVSDAGAPPPVIR